MTPINAFLGLLAAFLAVAFLASLLNDRRNTTKRHD